MATFAETQNVTVKVLRGEVRLVSGKESEIILMVPQALQSSRQHLLDAEHYVEAAGRKLAEAATQEEFEAILTTAENTLRKQANNLVFNKPVAFPQ